VFGFSGFGSQLAETSWFYVADFRVYAFEM
jgi:hypothetical protein